MFGLSRRARVVGGCAAGSDLLLAVLARPALIQGFDEAQWEQLLRTTRCERILGRLGAAIDAAGYGDACPAPVAAMLRAARVYPRHLQCRARWELQQVLEATSDLGVELLALKGLAYLEVAPTVASARMLSDIDLLIRADELAAVETALLAVGWRHTTLNDYDQRYYREWMHEMPPLSHPERGMEVDLHHRILPRTSRLHPDPVLMWQASRCLGERLRVLAPADMVLHAATHLFYTGEIQGRFTELLDLHLLFLQFADEAGFWAALPERARLLELQGPLYYAVRFCAEFLNTPFPDRLWEEVQRGAPGGRLFEAGLIRRALPPSGRGASLSAWLLYVRSHWIRMPPWLLAQHLTRKAWRRLPQPGATESRPE